VEIDNVSEAAFLYLFSHNGSALQEKAQLYYIAIDGEDPPKSLMDRFSSHSPQVAARSQQYAPSAAEAKKPCLWFTLSDNQWVSDDEIVLTASYKEGSLSAATYTLRLKNSAGRWAVVESVMVEVS
jgi:hypothetical protein